MVDFFDFSPLTEVSFVTQVGGLACVMKMTRSLPDKPFPKFRIPLAEPRHEPLKLGMLLSEGGENRGVAQQHYISSYSP